MVVACFVWPGIRHYGRSAVRQDSIWSARNVVQIQTLPLLGRDGMHSHQDTEPCAKRSLAGAFESICNSSQGSGARRNGAAVQTGLNLG